MSPFPPGKHSLPTPHPCCDEINTPHKTKIRLGGCSLLCCHRRGGTAPSNPSFYKFPSPLHLPFSLHSLLT
ncbi:hypothetical protein XELAEV_18035269mg [Xenopus laevis]|uniref:Uncharacterized protein n=1 Tax=Xenopus laevis TaxID=8355 RepID=A0A974CHL8_XENLA|nr:hypothetical protein XELAEV_18035269mg [Xenopus laevis]